MPVHTPENALGYRSKSDQAIETIEAAARHPMYAEAKRALRGLV